ncbi:hypothetical protein [Clostridium sp.]|jgi:hypothetical protein|nr:hypothetical protein [Clostridium sp.]MDU7215844.1 hypothetical protein [Clostridium sp.]MDU7238116.1 hypothetical protein [Clostridium perfringens]
MNIFLIFIGFCFGYVWSCVDEVLYRKFIMKISFKELRKKLN